MRDHDEKLFQNVLRTSIFIEKLTFSQRKYILYCHKESSSDLYIYEKFIQHRRLLFENVLWMPDSSFLFWGPVCIETTKDLRHWISQLLQTTNYCSCDRFIPVQWRRRQLIWSRFTFASAPAIRCTTTAVMTNSKIEWKVFAKSPKSRNPFRVQKSSSASAHVRWRGAWEAVPWTVGKVRR